MDIPSSLTLLLIKDRRIILQNQTTTAYLLSGNNYFSFIFHSGLFYLMAFTEEASFSTNSSTSFSVEYLPIPILKEQKASSSERPIALKT